MSTLPRAQKPKVPLLRVPLEGGPDYSLSDSEVSRRSVRPSAGDVEERREREREREKREV